jgi:lipopolysaccharide biosynthesis glycosyltransferase
MAAGLLDKWRQFAFSMFSCTSFMAFGWVFLHNSSQSIQCLFSGNSKKLMAPGFNYIVGDEISIQEKILIKHFAGSPKPWQLDKAGKEFLLAVQGAKYFSPRDWITQSSDAFLDFPKYWQIEAELLSYVQNFDDGLGQIVAGLRNRNLKKLDFVSRVKHYLIQLISRRFS